MKSAYKYYLKSRASNNCTGFSLLELIVAVSILSMLAGISMPRIGNFINSSHIDSVKAKLNGVAANCLQDLRAGGDPSKQIESSVFSNEILANEGYKISENMNTCASLMVETTKDDPYFFPMGFTISNGRLTKFAFPYSSDSESSCKAWAGSNCKAGEELLDLIAHNKSVEEEKTKCSQDFYSWLNGNPPIVPEGDGKKNRWNATADSDCKRVPPANKTETCTTNGCTLETWAFEGTIVAGEDGYKEALERKYGKICTEKLSEIEAKKDTGGPVTILECGANKKMWFFEGVDQGSEAEMNKKICIKNQEKHRDDRTTGETKITECGDKTFYYCLGDDKGTADLMTSCINANKEASCQNAINEAISSNYDGRFVADSGGPGVCSQVQWLCKGESFSTEESYEGSTCGTPSCGDPPASYCKQSAFYSAPKCIAWARCLKYID